MVSSKGFAIKTKAKYKSNLGSKLNKFMSYNVIKKPRHTSTDVYRNDKKNNDLRITL